MKKTRFLFSVLFLNAFLCLFVLACKNNSAPDETPEKSPYNEVSDEEFIEGFEISEAKVVKTKTTATMNAWTIIYPSKDPYGNAIMLSAVISVSTAINADNPAKALVLYNHATINKATECPSRGSLWEQSMIAGMASTFPVITISPDYYGFGCTQKYHQAYCIGDANAQASVDALIAAKKLLPELGYSDYGTKLFNMGYSQGGQTTMAVLKLVTEKYKDIMFTRTFAGAGPYDLEVFYNEFLASDDLYMPSAIIDVLYAYNEYEKLGFSLEQLFNKNIIDDFDEWFKSKKYTTSEINTHLGSLNLNKQNMFTPEVLNKDSDIAKKLLGAFEKDSILNGWTPATNESIYLYHHKNDETVTVETTNALKAFLIKNGLSVSDVAGQGLNITIDDKTEASNNSFHAAGIWSFLLSVQTQASALL